MRTLLLLLLLAASAAFADPPADNGDGERLRAADLAWMAGRWCSSSESATAEEVWLAPHGGVLLGLHRDVRQDRGVFFEYLRIVEEDGAIVYYASPAGRSATPFPLKQAAGWRVTFENPGHDYPQRIIYQREGDVLTSTIEGDVDGELRTSSWRWRKDACGFLDRD